MDYLYVKTEKNIIKCLDEIVNDHNFVITDPIIDIDGAINQFMMTYIKIKKYMIKYRNDVQISSENRYVAECVLEDIISKIEDDIYLKPIMDKNANIISIKLKTMINENTNKNNVIKVKLL
jgi:hypothetical protein